MLDTLRSIVQDVNSAPTFRHALDVIVARGASLEFGARYLKRVIDEAISLPISSRWQAGPMF